MQPLTKFFEDNKKININVDNDGVFSSVILKKFYDCDVCGFNNNDKTIIYQNNTSFDKLVYVDLHVGYPTIKSIDQHMVSVDSAHNEFLKNNPYKINPNIDYDIVWANYTNKFPFSTTIFLLIKADIEGKDMSCIDLNKKITDDIRLGDLIWQTDSSYENHFKYTRNTTNWMERMIALSNNSKFTVELFRWLEEEIPKDYHDRDVLTTKIGLMYKEGLHCDNNHGGMKNGFINEDGAISDKLYRYLVTIGDLFDVDMSNMGDKKFETKTFKSKRFSYSDVKDRFDSTKLFSYGFIWGMYKDKNISATYE